MVWCFAGNSGASGSGAACFCHKNTPFIGCFKRSIVEGILTLFAAICENWRVLRGGFLYFDFYSLQTHNIFKSSDVLKSQDDFLEEAMTTTQILQSAQFVVDSDGTPQAAQLNISHWEELVALLTQFETWEQDWHRPFDAVREAWDASSPAPDENEIPEGEALARLVHQVRDEV